MASFPPFGYDSGLGEGFLSFPLPFENMTEEEVGMLLQFSEIGSPVEADSPYAASEVAKSPGKSSLQQCSSTGASSSRSPTGTASLILTPSSTLLEYHGDGPGTEAPEGSDQTSTSPESNISPQADDFVFIERFVSDSSGGPLMNTQQPPQASVRVPSSQYHSRASSITPSTTPSQTQWQLLASTFSDGWMDPSQPGQFGSFDGGTQYTFNGNPVTATESFNDDLNTAVGSFDNRLYNTTPLPFRTSDGSLTYAQTPFPQGSLFAVYDSHETGQAFDASMAIQQQRQLPGLPTNTHPSFTSASSQQSFQQTTIPRAQAAVAIVPSQGAASQTHRSSQSHRTRPSTQPFAGVVRSRRAPYTHTSTYLNPTPVLQVRQQQRWEAEAQPSASRPLQPAVPGPSRATASTVVLPSPMEPLSRRGGRKKHSHLPEGTRTKSHNMRKKVACWRCALQRDPCPDENTPCARCVAKAQKIHPFYFGCDRSKLPDLIHDFLPSLMTLMHKKDTIENYVQKEVLRWDRDNFVDVYLTSGYGPALKWRLYEFVPRSQDMLVQLQYLQDTVTRSSRRFAKYSPPFALLKLDTGDDEHFEKYMQHLLSAQYLKDFGWTCFEEETQIDDFQGCLLQLLCDLYMATHDPEFYQLLQKLIRMMIVTYVMGHTLTIVEETLHGVIDVVKHTRPPQQFVAQHISPRLANRQLKFFFSQLRDMIYNDVLNCLQQTLRSSSKKEQTWLPSFCAMLGLAMVLEEQQRTLHIQADAKIAKSELSAEEAYFESQNACERIDERFNFLIALFQCKYRDRKWTTGSFGNQTPDIPDPTTRRFLDQIYHLLQEKDQHLQTRKDVEYDPSNQCQYTSRLVARFLLPFLDLPS